MTIKKLSFRQLHTLLRNQYLRDFPSCERKPYTTILGLYLRRCYFGYGIYSGGQMTAYALMMTGGDDALLDYFAVEPHLRGQGNGTAALGALCDHFQSRGCTVLAEIEIEEPDDAPGVALEKTKRRHFYQNCGWQISDAVVRLFDVNYQIIAKGSTPFSDTELRERVDAFYRAGIIGPVYRQKVFWRD